jgi:integrase
VTLDGKHITVEKDRAKNKSSYRSLPLVAEFSDILTILKEYQLECQVLCGNCYNRKYLEYIFVDEMGNRIRPNYVSDNFQITLKNNGLRKIRFHDLRHTAASLLLANGVSMKEIQEWLGHSDFGTTANIYGHLDVNAKIRSADAMRATGMKLGA